MRRMSKAKKGKAGANATEHAQESDIQDNGNNLPSDDETANENRIFDIKRNKRGRRSGLIDNKNEEEDPNAESEGDDVPLSQKAKKTKKGQKSNNREPDYGSEEENAETVEEGGQEEGSEEYEVEKVVDSRMYRGVKQFRIRWKGFTEDKDTWESETDLNCKELIDEFLSENPIAFKASEKGIKGQKKRKTPTNSVQPKARRQRMVEPVSEEGGEKIYEVDRVVEVYFKKNGEREFLIRWKGFSSEDDTWEPESNLNCPELIEKFMQKVDKAKELSARELRANPQMTKRFTLNTREPGRRLSSRHQSRQRATYYNTE